MTRRSIEDNEATKNIIFMFEVRHVFYTDDGYAAWVRRNDGECDCGDPGGEDSCDTCQLSDSEFDDLLIEEEKARSTWISGQRIFATREEGENFGEAKSYDYGRKGKDWRVYGTVAQGDLAKILHENTDYVGWAEWMGDKKSAEAQAVPTVEAIQKAMEEFPELENNA